MRLLSFTRSCSHPISPMEVRLSTRQGPQAMTSSLLHCLVTVSIPIRIDCLSELVSNAVFHSGLEPSASVHLRVELTDQVLRVEVCDEGPGFSREGRPAPGTDHHGWGLLIVERLTTRWGIQDPPVTTVWAELA